MSRYRTIQRILKAPLVSDGDGVAIHRAFPNGQLSELDPFLLLDHLGPVDLKPGEAKGFPDHPHRGFETVTYLLAGEFEHRDSFGHHGVLRPGDVQWMTAGSGLVHSETPGANLVKQGGRLEGFQLWINLPKKDKMKAPRYQEFTGDRIPLAVGADGGVQVKVIAGQAFGIKGAVETHIPIEYLHFKLKAGAAHVQEIAPDLSAMIYVIRGALRVAGKTIPQFHLGALENDGEAVEFSVTEDTELLCLAAQALHEPVARYGPFVMNTEAELHQAFADYRAGKLGTIALHD